MPSQQPINAPAANPAALPDAQALAGLGEAQIRALAASLIEQVQQSARVFEMAQTKLRHSQAKIEALTQELRLAAPLEVRAQERGAARRSARTVR